MADQLTKYRFAITDRILARMPLDGMLPLELFDAKKREWYPYDDAAEFAFNHRMASLEEAVEIAGDNLEDEAVPPKPLPKS